MRTKLWRELRSVFHWKYSGAFIPLFFATGVAMALASRFAMAYAFFASFGAWSVGYWLTGDFLRKKLADTRKRETRRSPERYKQEMLEYRVWQVTVIVGVMVLMLGFSGWTRSIQTELQEGALKLQREDVLNRLSVQAEPPPLFGNVDSFDVSISNGGHDEMDKHEVKCVVNGVVNDKRISWLGSWAPSETNVGEGLLGGGRGESITCGLPYILEAPIICGDLSVTVDFSIVGQPAFPMQKTFEFYFDKARGPNWMPKNPESRTEYCAVHYAGP